MLRTFANNLSFGYQSTLYERYMIKNNIPDPEESKNQGEYKTNDGVLSVFCGIQVQVSSKAWYKCFVESIDSTGDGFFITFFNTYGYPI